MQFTRLWTFLRFGPRALAETVFAQVHEHTAPSRALAGIGAGTYLHKRCSLRSPENIRLGANVSIGPDNRLWASPNAKLHVEDDVLLGPNVTILTSNHGTASLTESIVAQPWEESDVTVGKGAWIGANAVILPGVAIGAHSIVAANSVVRQDVADHAIVGGAPARLLRSRITAADLPVVIDEVLGDVTPARDIRL